MPRINYAARQVERSAINITTQSRPEQYKVRAALRNRFRIFFNENLRSPATTRNKQKFYSLLKAKRCPRAMPVQHFANPDQLVQAVSCTRQKTQKPMWPWPLTLIFNRLLEVVRIHVRTKFHQTECSGQYEDKCQKSVLVVARPCHCWKSYPRRDDPKFDALPTDHCANTSHCAIRYDTQSTSPSL